VIDVYPDLLMLVAYGAIFAALARFQFMNKELQRGRVYGRW